MSNTLFLNLQRMAYAQRPPPGMDPYQQHPAGMMPSPNMSHRSRRSEQSFSQIGMNTRGSMRNSSNGIPVMECKYLQVYAYRIIASLWPVFTNVLCLI